MIFNILCRVVGIITLGNRNIYISKILVIIDVISIPALVKMTTGGTGAQGLGLGA